MTAGQCLMCLEDARVHVVVATEEHGVILEEHWCPKCYHEHEKAEVK